MIAYSIVPPTRKRGRGAAKSTWFDRLRKLGKIPLKIKEGQTAPSCENATIFAGRVTWIVKLHAEMRRASWTHVPENEKEELIDRVRVNSDLIYDFYIYIVVKNTSYRASLNKLKKKSL